MGQMLATFPASKEWKTRTLGKLDLNAAKNAAKVFSYVVVWVTIYFDSTDPSFFVSVQIIGKFHKNHTYLFYITFILSNAVVDFQITW